ncbi:zinc finger protein brutus [Quercus suber]|uniref:Zinc finger protein brutus n=1 Tax=Quercus suber TaxID=58331 RepID=A0AAW0KWF3_QUESU
MATPGGVAVLPNSVNKVDSPSSSSSSTKAVVCVRSSEVKSPILIFLFFHKAIRNELDALHRSAMAFATGKRSDIRPMLERYHFLRSVYKHHSNAEDEVHFL